MVENAPTAFPVALGATPRVAEQPGAAEGILSQKEDYLRSADPTEYSFVKRYVGSWEQWEVVCNSEVGAPIIQMWRQELALKLSSEAFARILEASRGETRDALGANKYVYEALTKDKENKVGRPTKDAIKRAAFQMVEEDKARDEAYNRVFNTPSSVSPTGT